MNTLAAQSLDDDTRLFPLGLQRLLAASGIFFVVFVVLSLVFDPSDYPDYADSGAQWKAFVAKNGDDLQLVGFFGLFAALNFITFAGVMRSALARAEHHLRGFTRVADVAFAGAILATTAIVLANATGIAVASTPADTEAGVVRAMYHLSDALWLGGVVGFVVFLLNAGTMIVRTGVLPRWLGWVALVDALAWFLVLFIALDYSNEDVAIGAAWVPGFLLQLVFVAGASIALVRRVGTPWPWAGLAERT